MVLNEKKFTPKLKKGIYKKLTYSMIIILFFNKPGVQPPRDLVAQRTRDRDCQSEPPTKRQSTEYPQAQRGRPPLRRTVAVANEHSKTEPRNNIAKIDEKKEDKRGISYRGRGQYTTKVVSRNGTRNEQHEDEFTWRCNLCFKAFAVREQLEEHHCNGLGSAKNLICPHCNQNFSHPLEFRNHVESHANERPFRCGYCTHAFANAALLNQHVRVHIAESNIAKLGGRNVSERVAHEFKF